MNDEAARLGRPDDFADRSLSGYLMARRELERLRAGIWAALEALEAGDTWFACDVLLALVEDVPEHERHAA